MTTFPICENHTFYCLQPISSGKSSGFLPHLYAVFSAKRQTISILPAFLSSQDKNTGATLTVDSCFVLLDKQKSPDLSIETALLFSSTSIKRWFQPFCLHSLCLTNSFVCNFLSSSAGFNLCSCFFRLTLAFWLSPSGFSGPSIPRPVAASFPLSDLRCFRSLSLASVLDSDYSASALPFSRARLASQWLSRSRPHAFRFSGFPLAFALGSVTRLVRFELFGSPQTSHMLPPQPHFLNTYFLPFSTITLYFSTNLFPQTFSFLWRHTHLSRYQPSSLPTFFHVVQVGMTFVLFLVMCRNHSHGFLYEHS